MAADTGGRLAGKRAFVVGVGPGMGSAIAARFADEGAAVVMAARRTDALTDLAAAIQRRGGTAHGIPTDLTGAERVARLLEEGTRRLGGPPQILVNAAGGWTPGSADLDQPEVIDRMLALNLRTVMTTTPPFARAMTAAGGGAILNIAAVYGPLVAARGQAVYNATKAGVVGYTRAAAADLLDKGVRVNCIMPGGTRHDWSPDRDLSTVRRLGRDRVGAPEDIAAAALFLVSDEAAWITGAALAVDGGDSLRTA